MAQDLIMEHPLSDEEIEQLKIEYVQNMKMAHSLTEEQKNFLMDGGWYNTAMRGYIIAAAQYADFTPKQIKRLLDGFRCALDMKSKEDAEQVSKSYKG